MDYSKSMQDHLFSVRTGSRHILGEIKMREAGDKPVGSPSVSTDFFLQWISIYCQVQCCRRRWSDISRLHFSASFSHSPPALNSFLGLHGLFWQYCVFDFRLDRYLSQTVRLCLAQTARINGCFSGLILSPSNYRYWIFFLRFPIVHLKYNSGLPEGCMCLHMCVFA